LEEERDSLVRRGPGEEAAVRRVDTAAEVALWPGEAWERFIRRRGVEEADTLSRAIWYMSVLASACLIHDEDAYMRVG
jgi:hypothetical protein